MTRDEARQMALAYVKAMEGEAGCKLVLLDSSTIERSFGWVFFYNSQRYVESRNLRDAVAGNAPIVITKADGQIHITGTGHPLEYYLKRFEIVGEDDIAKR